MRALAVIRPNEMKIVDVPVPQPGPYDILIKSEAAFICNATDRKLVEGHFPGVGADQYPLLLGHENSGRVEKMGAKVKSFRPGDRVIGGLILSPEGGEFKSGWGGNAEYVLARDHQAMVADGAATADQGWDEIYQIMLKVPDYVQPDAAGLLCTWREVYAAFTDFNLQPAMRILVFGAGPVGLSFIRFAKLKGFAFIAVVEPQAAKHALAKKLGADVIYTPQQDFVTLFQKDAGGKADAVIDAVGHPAITNSALPLIKMAGSMCVYGVIADANITLEKHRGPYNFNLLVHQWPTRVYEAAAQAPLCEYIKDGRLSAADFVTGRYRLDDYAAAFAASRQPDAIKTMLTF